MVSTGVKKHPWNISIGLILSYGATRKQALRPNQPVLADLQASGRVISASLVVPHVAPIQKLWPFMCKTSKQRLLTAN